MALVLIVDDEEPVRRMIGAAVKRAGHDVMQAESAEAAVEVMQKRQADVVFTDISMPGHDGRWLTIQLRKRYPCTAVVLATSVTDLPTTITLRFGVLSYLIKPFDLDAVQHALKLAVAWHDETEAKGATRVEEDQLNQWLDSLQIL